MLLWIPPSMFTEQCLRLLARSTLAAPDAVGEPAHDILARLHEGKAQAFCWKDGLLVLEAHTPRLRIVAWAGDNSIFLRRELAEDLKKIAAEWRCDTIETTVFCPRLARAIARIGGEIESWTVTLSVEG